MIPYLPYLRSPGRVVRLCSDLSGIQGIGELFSHHVLRCKRSKGTNLHLPRWFEKLGFYCRYKSMRWKGKKVIMGFILQFHADQERPRHPVPPHPTPLMPARQSHDRLRNRFLEWFPGARTRERQIIYSALLALIRCWFQHSGVEIINIITKPQLMANFNNKRLYF